MITTILYILGCFTMFVAIEAMDDAIQAREQHRIPLGLWSRLGIALIWPLATVGVFLIFAQHKIDDWIIGRTK